MIRSRRAGLMAAVLVVLAVGAGLLVPAPASAEGFTGVFRANAIASGVRVTFIVPKGSVSDTIADVGAPSSESLLDSLGESRAFASFPYPGDLPSNLPGLLRGLAGIPAPDYPFYVSSFYPSRPRQQAGIGPYLIAAESSDSVTTATADIGYHDEAVGSVGALRSTTSAAAQSDGVVAQATDEISSFAVGPLKIGQVLSSALVKMGPDGTLTRQADTRFVGVMVGDTPVTITPQGVQVAGSPVANPVPAAPAEALGQAGITVALVAITTLPDGVVAPALRITYRTADGSSVNYELGAASATVQGTASEGAAPAPPVEETGTQEGAAASPPPGAPPAEPLLVPDAGRSAASETAPTVSVEGAAANADSMWLDTPSGMSAAAGAFAPDVRPSPSAPVASRPVPTARMTSPRPAASITRVSLLTHLINGGNLEPLYGGALILIAAGGAVLLAGLRRARVR